MDTKGTVICWIVVLYLLFTIIGGIAWVALVLNAILGHAPGYGEQLFLLYFLLLQVMFWAGQ